jgi:hypothetical protein
MQGPSHILRAHIDVHKDQLGPAGDHKVAVGGGHGHGLVKAEHYLGPAPAQALKLGQGLLNGKGVGPRI